MDGFELKIEIDHRYKCSWSYKITEASDLLEDVAKQLRCGVKTGNIYTSRGVSVGTFELKTQEGVTMKRQTMTLDDYVQEYCDGNYAEFSRLFGRSPSNISRLKKSPSEWRVFIEEKEHLLAQIRATRKVRK